MSANITDFIMEHPLFSHHDHNIHFQFFKWNHLKYDAETLLGYANHDMITAAGPGNEALEDKELVAKYWSKSCATGYGQAVNLGCKSLFNSEYSAENFDKLTEKLQNSFIGKSPLEIYNYFLKEKANVKWVLQDSCFAQGDASLLHEDMFPDYYRFAWRFDKLFAITELATIELLEKHSGLNIQTLDQLVNAMNANIDAFKESGKLAAFKLGIAYERDFNLSEPSRKDAEIVFDRICKKKEKLDWNDARSLGDYMLHNLLKRASDENIPVQIHTGILAGNGKDFTHSRALDLIPMLQKYNNVRFDIFHASYPWSSELCAIAKSFPNVYPDMCWMWAINPTEAERTLAEWLDAVPFNKIFAFGADTGFPWTTVGYAIQARIGIARVLENKVQRGTFSEATAKEIASAIMLKNGEEFYGLN